MDECVIVVLCVLYLFKFLILYDRDSTAVHMYISNFLKLHLSFSGKDVSALFPDVVNCMQTDNLELKKLVYLYLMNYAKSQPDMAIMAVNTFVKVQFVVIGFLLVMYVSIFC